MAFGKAATIELSKQACAADCCADKANELAQMAARTAQRRVLIVVLAINAAMFFVEMGAGIVAHSTSLMADSVDMFGDATVYMLSIYALDRGLRWRAGAALAKSAIIFMFGLVVLVEVGRRLIGGGTPDAGTIGLIGMVALAGNLTCLGLLWRFRAHDINMSSTFECSRNDVIANAGVLVAAAGVGVTGQAWPDLALAVVIAVVFLRSAFSIARIALPPFRLPVQTPA